MDKNKQKNIVLAAIHKEIKNQKLEIVKEIHPLVFLVCSKDKKKLYLIKGEALKKDLNTKRELYRKAGRKDSRILSSKLMLDRPNGVMMFEYIEGKDINSLIDTNPTEYFNIVRDIANAYVLFAAYKAIASNSKAQRIAKAIKWTKDSLKEWSRTLIEEDIVEEDDVYWLGKVIGDFCKKSAWLFPHFCHGNIIGDHVIKAKRKYYLLDLERLPRPAGQFYDRLRAIDYAVLKAKNLKAILPAVTSELKDIEETMGERAMRAIFALRCIGALGKDIFQNPKIDSIPDLKNKINFYRKHIERGFDLK